MAAKTWIGRQSASWPLRIQARSKASSALQAERRRTKVFGSFFQKRTASILLSRLALPQSSRFAEQILDAGHDEFKRCCIRQAVFGQLLMHGGDDDLRARERACADGGDGLVHLLMCPHAAGEGRGGGDVEYGLALQRGGAVRRESQSSAFFSTPDMP